MRGGEERNDRKRILTVRELYSTPFKQQLSVQRVIESMPKLPLILLTTLVLLQASISSTLQIPLTYAFDPVTPQKKYPIRLSFNSSTTTTPFKSPYLPLYNTNLTMQTTLSPSPTEQVTIGLQPPSIFLTALQQAYKIQASQIEISKDDYTRVIINNANLIESSDQFVNGGLMAVKAVYNFGDGLKIEGQRCVITDQDKVVFDQELIEEVLKFAKKDKRNNIQYVKDQAKETITVTGNLDNFPKISLLSGRSVFQLQIKLPTLHYNRRSSTQPQSSPSSSPSPSSQSQSQAPTTTIGYKTLTKFSKFQIEPTEDGQNKILFKRTSQLYQLYLFLGYFFLFTLGYILVSREKLEGSMQFVRSVVDWAVYGNQEARVRVLRTELE